MPNVVITGANRGLGFEMAKQYMEDGWDVFACCRKPESASDLRSLANQEKGRLHVLKMDVNDYDQIDAAVKELAGEAIDLLINNAGTTDCYGIGAYENVDDPDPMNYDYDLWMDILKTNLLSPTRVTGAFAPNLAKAEKPVVVMVASGLSSLTNTWMAGRYAYRSSKTGLNMIMRSMGEWLERSGIAIVSVSPGWTRTEMGGPNAHNDVKDSISGMRKVIATVTLDKTGAFYNFDGEEIPW